VTEPSTRRLHLDKNPKIQKSSIQKPEFKKVQFKTPKKVQFKIFKKKT